MSETTGTGGTVDDDAGRAGGSAGDQGVEILDFWEAASARARAARIDILTGRGVSSVPPPVWSFQDEDPQRAARALDDVVNEVRTATSSSAWEYADGDVFPEKGDLSILVDAAGHPRALLRTTTVQVVPFAEVGAEFAEAESEDDGSLEEWRASRRHQFEAALGREIPDDMPVVCERFEKVYPDPVHPRSVLDIPWFGG